MYGKNVYLKKEGIFEKISYDRRAFLIKLFNDGIIWSSALMAIINYFLRHAILFALFYDVLQSTYGHYKLFSTSGCWKNSEWEFWFECIIEACGRCRDAASRVPIKGARLLSEAKIAD